MSKGLQKIAFCFVFAGLLMMILMVFHLRRYEKNFIRVQKEQGMQFCESVKNEIEEYIKECIGKDMSFQEAEEAVVSEILQRYASDMEQFFIFASEDSLLFYQNEKLTSNREGYKMMDVLEQYTRNGGKNIESVWKMLDNGTSGVLEISMSDNNENYITSVNCFTINEKAYYLLYNVNRKKLFIHYGIKKHKVLIWIENIVFLLMILAAAALIVWQCQKYRLDMEKKEEEIFQKNSLLKKSNKKVKPGDADVLYGNPVSKENGVYDERFAKKLFEKLEAGKNTDVYIGVVKGRIAKDGNSTKKYGWNEFVREIKKSLTTNYVLLKMDSAHLVIIGLKTSKELFLKRMEQVKTHVDETYEKGRLQLIYGTGMKVNGNKTVYDAVDEAFNNLKERESKIRVLEKKNGDES